MEEQERYYTERRVMRVPVVWIKSALGSMARDGPSIRFSDELIILFLVVVVVFIVFIPILLPSHDYRQWEA